MSKKTFLPILAIMFLAFGASLTGILAQQKVHAQAPTTTPQAAAVSSVSNTAVSGIQSTADKETVDQTKESADKTSGAAENGNDGPGGHQDAQGASVDHQFEGTE